MFSLRLSTETSIPTDMKNMAMNSVFSGSTKCSTTCFGRDMPTITPVRKAPIVLARRAKTNSRPMHMSEMSSSLLRS